MSNLRRFLATVLMAIGLTLGLCGPVLATPYLTVTQTVPSTFINDSIGRVYQVRFQNTGDVDAQNVTVDINLPDMGFTFRPETLTATFRTDLGDLTGSNLTVVPSGTDPVHIAFDMPLTLAPGQILDLSYRIATSTGITGGEHYVLHVQGNYDDGTVTYNDQDETLIDIKAGLLAVTLTPVTPNPFEAKRGEQIVLEARLTNNGEGSLFGANLYMDWGTGFTAPALIPAESTITPVLNGNRYEITVDEIPAGESRYFRFQLTVNDYHNFDLTFTATNPAESGVTYTDTVIFTLLINQPKITISFPNLTIDYGITGAVDVTITNDNASGEQGPARAFALNTNLDALFTVTNLAAGWTYAVGRFTYIANNGVITAGETVHLTFSLTPKAPHSFSEGVPKTLLVEPDYQNDIEEPLRFPVLYPTCTLINIPVLTLEQIADAEGTDGDDYRVFLHEQYTFKFIAHLTHPEKFPGGAMVVLEDTVPAEFIIQSVSVNAGLIEQTGNFFRWTLTPGEAAANPELSIVARVTSDPALAGRLVTNAGVITGTTVWNCLLTYTRTIRIYIQSREEEAIFVKETKSVTNRPVEGSFDVCGKDGKDEIEYLLEYSFDPASGGTWTETTITEGMDQNQVYVPDSAQYRIGAGLWEAIPGGSILSASPLTFDLGFIKNILGTDYVYGQEVSFKYRLTLTNASLSPGTTGVHSFLARTDMKLANATGGHELPDGDHFYQGVFVPISRAALNLKASIPTMVTKGQVIRVTLTVEKLTPWDNNNLTITVPTGGAYSYRGNPAYTGFGDMIPDVSIIPAYPDTVTFAFTNPLTVNQGGTISFDMVKTESANFDLNAGLSFGDDLAAQFTDSVTVTPDLKLEGLLSVTVYPDPVKVTTHTLTWRITVTNIGSGTAYQATVTNSLKDFMQYLSSTVDGAPVTPDIVVDAVNHLRKLTWTLGDLSPGLARTIEVTVQTDGSSADFTNGSSFSASPAWEDRDEGDHPFNLVAVTRPVFATMLSSSFVKNSADNPIELCGVGTVKLYLRNNGFTHNYNMILTQDLGLTGFTYQPGTARISGVSINDPEIVGNKLIWTYTSGAANYLAQLEDMAPQEEFTIEYDVLTHEDFNIYQKIQPSVTWQTPSEYGGGNRSGSYTGAEYRIPINRPFMVLVLDGKNITTGDPDYMETVTASVGDEVDWRVRITNSGPVAARNVTLNNVLPAGMTFSSITPEAMADKVPGQS